MDHPNPYFPIVRITTTDSVRSAYLAVQFRFPSRSANKGLEYIDASDRVLLTTADHALLTPEIVEHFLRESIKVDGDATVGLVKHKDVLSAFPGTRRTVIKLRDGGFCGCNLYSFLNYGSRDLVSFWRRAEDLRKYPWRLVGKYWAPWLFCHIYLGYQH